MAKEISELKKEVIRVTVQNAVCENLDLVEVIGNLEGFGLTTKECKWAIDNLDWKVIIL